MEKQSKHTRLKPYGFHESVDTPTVLQTQKRSKRTTKLKFDGFHESAHSHSIADKEALYANPKTQTIRLP
jgi:hypothetical protein